MESKKAVSKKAEPSPNGWLSTNAFLVAVFIAGGLSSAILAGALTTVSTTLPEQNASPKATIRHLFSTPLYQSNIADKIDMNHLTALATDGHRSVMEDADLRNTIRQNKETELCRDAGSQLEECKQILQDVTQFTYNDMFFHWQMHHGEDKLPEFGGFSPNMIFFKKSDAHTPELKAFMSHIRDVAVPRYMKALGVSKKDIPIFGIQMWAAVVASNDHTHQIHEHFTSGECLCSGVMYAQAPIGSGPISFKDVRKPRSNEISSGYFPSSAYDHTPITGDLLLFPPWAPHEVKPSRNFKTDGSGVPRVAWAFNVMSLRGFGQPSEEPAGAPAKATRDLHSILMDVIA